MTETPGTTAENGEQPGDAIEQSVDAPVGPKWRDLLQLPGLAAIGVYLAAVAGVIVVGVVSHNYPALFLVFSVLFFAASGGLMLLLRWAWALALGAVLLMAVYNSWIFTTEHLAPALVQGLLNWVFFLYMIRVEVRSKLK